MTHSDLSTRVGKPIRSRSSGVLTIPISRRINRPDGSFGGVAMASLNSIFSRSFTTVLTLAGPAPFYWLSTTERYCTAARLNEVMVGTSIENGRVYQLYKKCGPAGTAMLVAKLDGIERLYSYRHLEGFPLLVATAESKDEILKSWWIEVVKTT